MATNEVGIKFTGTIASEIVWSDTTDYNPTGTGDPARTHQIDLTSLASLAARQGAKADLGAVSARRWAVDACVEINVAAVSGQVIEIWLAPSSASGAGDYNPAGVNGADSAFPDTAYSGDAVGDAIKQSIGPYALTLTDDLGGTDDPQRGTVGIYVPTMRYVSPIFYNLSGQALEGDAIEMWIRLTPLIDDIQAAA